MSTSYLSTRDPSGSAAAGRGFAEVLVAGLAPDGGLYCPVEVPPLPDLSDLPDAATTAADPANAAGTTDTGSYAEVARRVMWPYVESGADHGIDEATFAGIVAAAYAGFRHPDVCPLVELGDGHHLLDLTQGPTLAFKDVALQLVGRLLDYELDRRGLRVVVINATSGDTGSAAIEALAGRRNITAVVLHPHNRVSEVQRRQMTTVTAPNIHNLAVEGTFDDCQDLLKAAFASDRIGGRHHLVAVNSINWARVMAQIVYYVTAARSVAPGGGPVSFSVPTGNFGNVLAGWYAKRMGLAIDQLIIASNSNDVLTRYFETGDLAIERVVPTLSPSMDIQVSSNFERLLWEASGRDGAQIADLIGELRRAGRVTVAADWTAAISAEFDAARFDDAATLAEIKRVHGELGLVIDPHTAVALRAGRELRRDRSVPMVTLATADPAKFGDAVEQATGTRPPLPPFLAELYDRREHYNVVPNDLRVLADYIDSFDAVATTNTANR